MFFNIEYEKKSNVAFGLTFICQGTNYQVKGQLKPTRCIDYVIVFNSGNFDLGHKIHFEDKYVISGSFKTMQHRN